MIHTYIYMPDLITSYTETLIKKIYTPPFVLKKGGKLKHIYTLTDTIYDIKRCPREIENTHTS